MDNLPIARGYCRVSTHYQSEDGISLDTQHKRIADHCLYKGLKLVQIYEDAGLSGKDMKRPGLLRLLDEIKSGEYMVVADLSRLSRSTRDALSMLEQLKDKGVRFVCLSPDIEFYSPIGELMFTVLMAVHRLERQNISAHVSANMKRLSEEGKLRGRAPFGYRFVGKDRDFEPEPEQQAVIQKIKDLYFQGMKYAQIARKLNEDGDNQCLTNNKRTVDPEKICQFFPQTVKRILLDENAIPQPNPNSAIDANRVPIERRIISYRKPQERTPQSASS